MKIGMIGFGKTGKAVAQVLLSSPEVQLQWVVRRTRYLEHRSVAEYLGLPEREGDSGLIYSTEEFSAQALLQEKPVEVMVDFSSPEGIEYYGNTASRLGVQIVSAVSQYPDLALERLKQWSTQTVVLHSPNITLGINFLIIAAKILKNIAPYTDIEIIESHFKTKPEVSGTAKTIAHELEINVEAIKSLRAGGIIGVHEILFGFPYQTVRLTHESISRESFGDGILFAVKNLRGKKPGFYNMNDLLLPYFKLQDSEEIYEQAQKKPWWKFWL